MPAEIVVVGSLNMDVVVQAPRQPLPGETLQGDDLQLLPGGKGANQAAAAARLGGQVRMLGCVGDDAFGRRLLQAAADAGVLTDGIAVDPDAPTGTAVIVVEPSGENSIIIVAGANGRLEPAHLASDVGRAAFASAGICLLQLEVPMATVARAAREARREDCLVILDPAPAQELPPPLLGAVDILVPNATELAQLVDADSVEDLDPVAAARELQGRGVGTVIVTMGAEGVLLVDEAVQRIEGYPVDAVDTTAAGDAFAGALALGLSAGRPLTQAAGFANAAAALACTRMGAQPSLPTWQQVVAFIETRHRNESS